MVGKLFCIIVAKFGWIGNYEGSEIMELRKIEVEKPGLPAIPMVLAFLFRLLYCNRSTIYN